MSDSSQSSKSTKPAISNPSNPRKLTDTGSMFASSDQHQQSADLVFKNDIDVIFASKMIGVWKNQQYEVTRKYIQSQTPGVHLYVTIFRPLQVTAAVLFVHGQGEHQGRYVQTADMFARNGYQVVLYDQRGYGHSGGIRGDTTIEFMHKDIDTALQQIEQDVPTFCYAHGMGAALIISFCQINPDIGFQGIITTSAQINIPEKYNKVKQMLVHIIDQFLPNLMINLYPSFSQASKNNYHIKKLAEDTLLQPFMTINTANQMIQLSDFVQPNADKFTTPILLIHGKLDTITSHMGSVEFYGQCKSTDRTLKIFEYGYHEIHCDTEKNRLQQLALDWCTNSLKTSIKIADISKLQHGLKFTKYSFKIKLFFIFALLYVLYKGKLKYVKFSQNILLFKALMTLLKKQI